MRDSFAKVPAPTRRPVIGLAKLCLAALVASTVVLPAAAGVYRWTDADGVVHYSDRPGVADAQRLEATPGRVAPSASARGNASEAPARPGPEDAAGDAETRAVRAEQCQKARERLARFEQAQEIVAADADGEQRTLDADERVQTIVRTRQQVAALCADR